MTAFVDALLAVIRDQWTFFGRSQIALDGTKRIRGREDQSPYIQRVAEYWAAVGETFDGTDRDQPWSAAFVSWCFKTANAGAQFPYNSSHAQYVGSILSGGFPRLSLADPATTAVAVGDLLWNSRRASGSGRPPRDYAEAVRRVRNGDFFPSHCDIVIAMRSDEIDSVGGNVEDSVTMTTYRSDAGFHITDPRKVWIGVVKNGL